MNASTLSLFFILCIVALGYVQSSDVLLFVHGGWHTSSQWESTVRAINDRYVVSKTVAVNLTGRRQGQNTCENALSPQQYSSLAPLYASVTISNYTQDIVDAIEANKKRGKVHIVSHSLGSAYVQHALSVMPERTRWNVASFTSLSGYLTMPNVPVVFYTQLGPETNTLLSNLFAPLGTPLEQSPMICVNATASASIFYNACSVEERNKLSRALVYEPSIPIVTPLENKLREFTDIRQYYIKTKNDNAISSSTQLLMIEQQLNLANEMFTVVGMSSDHSPYLCDTQNFAKRIGDLIGLKKKKKRN